MSKSPNITQNGALDFLSLGVGLDGTLARGLGSNSKEEQFVTIVLPMCCQLWVAGIGSDDRTQSNDCIVGALYLAVTREHLMAICEHEIVVSVSPTVKGLTKPINDNNSP
jgi:hypothetical protein